MNRIHVFLLFVVVFIFAGGCSTSSSPANGPPITFFTSKPQNPNPGDTVLLLWSIAGATNVSIDNGIGDVTIDTAVKVVAKITTIYTLTAKNAGGTSVAQTTMNVK
jgi:hypothetical protein